MYTSIIHNLKEGDLGYNEANAFNALIANKPKGVDMTLDQKIEAQRLWKAQCDDAYNMVKQSVGA